MKEQEIDPEFENQYIQVDKKVGILAQAILEHVAKYDTRILKKINIRLDKMIQDIKEIE